MLWGLRLQWGRDHVIAETQRPPPTRKPPLRFNGAAIT